MGASVTAYGCDVSRPVDWIEVQPRSCSRLTSLISKKFIHPSEAQCKCSLSVTISTVGKTAVKREQGDEKQKEKQWSLVSLAGIELAFHAPQASILTTILQRRVLPLHTLVAL